MHICLQLASLRTNFPLITVIKSTFIHDVHAREFPLFAFQTPNAHSKPDTIDAMFSPIPHSHKSSNTALHVKAPFNPPKRRKACVTLPLASVPGLHHSAKPYADQNISDFYADLR